MNDIHAAITIPSSLKTKDFMIMTISCTEKQYNCSQYIPEDKIPLIEIACEDGVFLVLLSDDDYQKLDLK